jgi:aminoglycoside 3-N-acetyltransferase
MTAALSELSVPRDRIVYVHSSSDWLAKADIRLGEAYEALIDWTGRGGTLVMPAFPFRGSHEAYLRGAPVFDARRSPARVGLLNETLRRRPGVKRSLDPDLSIVAFGPLADQVTGPGLTGADPMGADSPFQRIIDLGGAFLGLGVSFNYMSLIHVLDARYRSRYPFEIYSASLYRAQVIDAAGRRHEVTKQAMRNEVQIYIKPGEIVRQLHPGRDVFRSLKRGETDFFVWELPQWEPFCLEHIERSLQRGGVPCWLAQVQSHLAQRPAGTH